jgi:hypothetical protein
MNDTLHSELTVGVARAMLRCAAALIACAFVARVCSDGLKYDVHLQQLEQKADQCNLLSIDRGRKHYVTAARHHRTSCMRPYYNYSLNATAFRVRYC